MTIKGIIKQGEYFDSVTLMLVSKEINARKGIIDSGVVMGTKENRAILQASGLLLPEFEHTSDTDLLIAIKAEDGRVLDLLVKELDSIFNSIRKKKGGTKTFNPRSFDGAIKAMPDANLSLISVAGKYAAQEAMHALKKGLHVMIFSDNVSVEDELKLKTYASKKGLLVMGPDCGTAIINGVPLAFANVVNKGNIGIVAASGTGLQETSCIISNSGAGISQAIGTGGRDVKKEIGGIMFLDALRALKNDPQTEVILLVSKPPHESVLEKIAAEIKSITKPVVGIFIGADPEIIKKAGAIPATTLEMAALTAVFLSQGKNTDDVKARLEERNQQIRIQANEMAKTLKGKYLRGLFSGGTLCDETQLILKEHLGYVNSNTPLHPDFRLQDAWKPTGHAIIDLGDDDFTVGRPHPMIDYSLRNKKIIDEAGNQDVAVLLLDVVLGYGSNMHPEEELVPNFFKAKKMKPELHIICSITGTDKDPQNKANVKTALENAGALVMPSNAAASELCAQILLTAKV
jgi:succinyl-CoA synthetase alpha subunit